MPLQNVSSHARVNQHARDAVAKARPSQAQVPADKGLQLALNKVPEQAKASIQNAISLRA